MRVGQLGCCGQGSFHVFWHTRLAGVASQVFCGLVQVSQVKLGSLRLPKLKRLSLRVGSFRRLPLGIRARSSGVGKVPRGKSPVDWSERQVFMALRCQSVMVLMPPSVVVQLLAIVACGGNVD